LRSQRLHTVALAIAATLISASVAAEGTFFKSRTAQPTPTTTPASQQQSSGGQTTPAPTTPVPTTPEPTTPTPPPTEPVPQQDASQQPHVAPISGTIERVVTTSTFVVGGQQFDLFGVIGEPAPYTTGLSGWLAANGNRVNCTPEGGKYRCFTPGKADVGGVVIFNGAGKAAPDAPQEYVAAEQKAQAQRKGVWH
jgi:endonuclease YncB( thermonuclease family)